MTDRPVFGSRTFGSLRLSIGNGRPLRGGAMRPNLSELLGSRRPGGAVGGRAHGSSPHTVHPHLRAKAAQRMAPAAAGVVRARVAVCLGLRWRSGGWSVHLQAEGCFGAFSDRRGRCSVLGRRAAPPPKQQRLRRLLARPRRQQCKRARPPGPSAARGRAAPGASTSLPLRMSGVRGVPE